MSEQNTTQAMPSLDRVRLRSQCYEIDKTAIAATGGPWSDKFGDIVSPRLPGHQRVISWTGFDSSDASKTKVVANRAHIIATNPAAARRLAAGCRAALDHLEQAEARIAELESELARARPPTPPRELTGQLPDEPGLWFYADKEAVWHGVLVRQVFDDYVGGTTLQVQHPTYSDLTRSFSVWTETHDATRWYGPFPAPASA